MQGISCKLLDSFSQIRYNVTKLLQEMRVSPMQHTKEYSEENLVSLRNEVEKLENVTWVAIEDLEKKLNSLADISPVDEADWTPNLQTVEIYTFEEVPPLSKSIRQITNLKFS